MTNRERAMNILRYKDVDRLPAVHFGYWGELLVEWAEQGKIPRELAEGNWDGSQMDKNAFRKDKAAVDAEIERMKRLVSLGGFIPCPDHRLMPGSKFELVQYYAEEIKKIRL